MPSGIGYEQRAEKHAQEAARALDGAIAGVLEPGAIRGAGRAHGHGQAPTPLRAGGMVQNIDRLEVRALGPFRVGAIEFFLGYVF